MAIRIPDKRVGNQELKQQQNKAAAQDPQAGVSTAVAPKPAVSGPVATGPTTAPKDAARIMGEVVPPARLGDAAVAGPAPKLRAAFDALPTVGGGPAQARLLSDNLDSWNARWEMLEGADESIDAVCFSL